MASFSRFPGFSIWVSFRALLRELPEVIIFGYLSGFLPALATGILTARLGQISAHWSSNALVSGLIGAAVSAIYFFVLSFRESHFGSPGTTSANLVFSLTGFIAGFCCSLINRYFERKPELPNSATGAGEGPMS
jgi:uncharacterized membrane protein